MNDLSAATLEFQKAAQLPYPPSKYKPADYSETLGLDLRAMHQQIDKRLIDAGHLYSDRIRVEGARITPQPGMFHPRNPSEEWVDQRFMNELQAFIGTNAFRHPVIIFARVAFAENPRREANLTSEEVNIGQSILRNLTEVLPRDYEFGECRAPFRTALGNWLLEDVYNLRIALEAAMLIVKYLKSRRQPDQNYGLSDHMYKDAHKASRCVFDLLVARMLAQRQQWLSVSSKQLIEQLCYEQENYWMPLIGNTWKYLLDTTANADQIVVDAMDSRELDMVIDPVVTTAMLRIGGYDVDEMARLGELKEFVNTADYPPLSRTNQDAFQQFMVYGYPVIGLPVIRPRTRAEQKKLQILSATNEAGSVGIVPSLSPECLVYYPEEQPQAQTFVQPTTATISIGPSLDDELAFYTQVAQNHQASLPEVFSAPPQGSPVKEQIPESEKVHLLSTCPPTFIRHDDPVLPDGRPKIWRHYMLQFGHNLEHFINNSQENDAVEAACHAKGYNSADLTFPQPLPPRSDDLPIVDLIGRVFFDPQHINNILTYWPNQPSAEGMLAHYREQEAAFNNGDSLQYYMRTGLSAEKAAERVEREKELWYWGHLAAIEAVQAHPNLRMAMGLCQPNTHAQWAKWKFGATQQGPFGCVFGPYYDANNQEYHVPSTTAFGMPLYDHDDGGDFDRCGTKISNQLDILTDKNFRSPYIMLDGQLVERRDEQQLRQIQRHSPCPRTGQQLPVTVSQYRLATGEMLTISSDHPYCEIMEVARVIYFTVMRLEQKLPYCGWLPAIPPRRPIPNPPAQYAKPMVIGNWLKGMPAWLRQEFFYQPAKMYEDYFYKKATPENLISSGFSPDMVEMTLNYMEYMRKHPYWSDEFHYLTNYEYEPTTTAPKDFTAMFQDSRFATTARQSTGWGGAPTQAAAVVEPLPPQAHEAPTLVLPDNSVLNMSLPNAPQIIDTLIRNKQPVGCQAPNGQIARVRPIGFKNTAHGVFVSFYLYDEYMEYVKQVDEFKRTQQATSSWGGAPSSARRDIGNMWVSTPAGAEQPPKPVDGIRLTDQGYYFGDDVDLSKPIVKPVEAPAPAPAATYQRAPSAPQDPYSIDLSAPVSAGRQEVPKDLPSRYGGVADLPPNGRATGIPADDQARGNRFANVNRDRPTGFRIDPNDGPVTADPFFKQGAMPEKEPEQSLQQALNDKPLYPSDPVMETLLAADETEARALWAEIQKHDMEKGYPAEEYYVGCVPIRGREDEYNLARTRIWKKQADQARDTAMAEGVDLRHVNINPPTLLRVNGKTVQLRDYVARILQEQAKARVEVVPDRTYVPAQVTPAPVDKPVPQASVLVDAAYAKGNRFAQVLKGTADSVPKSLSPEQAELKDRAMRKDDVVTEETPPAPLSRPSKTRYLTGLVATKRPRKIVINPTTNKEIELIDPTTREVTATRLESLTAEELKSAPPLSDHDNQVIQDTVLSLTFRDVDGELAPIPTNLKTIVVDHEVHGDPSDCLPGEDPQPTTIVIKSTPVVQSAISDEEVWIDVDAMMYNQPNRADPDDHDGTGPRDADGNLGAPAQAVMTARQILTPLVGDVHSEEFIATLADSATLLEVADRLTKSYAALVRRPGSITKVQRWQIKTILTVDKLFTDELNRRFKHTLGIDIRVGSFSTDMPGLYEWMHNSGFGQYTPLLQAVEMEIIELITRDRVREEDRKDFTEIYLQGNEKDDSTGEIIPVTYLASANLYIGLMATYKQLCIDLPADGMGAELKFDPVTALLGSAVMDALMGQIKAFMRDQSTVFGKIYVKTLDGHVIAINRYMGSIGRYMLALVV
jgi:hypothetical protein